MVEKEKRFRSIKWTLLLLVHSYGWVHHVVRYSDDGIVCVESVLRLRFSRALNNDFVRWKWGRDTVAVIQSIFCNFFFRSYSPWVQNAFAAKYIHVRRRTASLAQAESNNGVFFYRAFFFFKCKLKRIERSPNRTSLFIGELAIVKYT